MDSNPMKQLLKQSLLSFGSASSAKKKKSENTEIYLVGAENFEIEDVAANGNCMFTALSKQLHMQGIQRSASCLRHEISDYINSNKSEVEHFSNYNLEAVLGNGQRMTQYFARMRQSGEWGDGIMLSGASLLYKKQIIVYHCAGSPISLLENSTDNDTAPLRIGFVNGNHYVSLRLREQGTTSATPVFTTSHTSQELEESEEEGSGDLLLKKYLVSFIDQCNY